jgi:hypothetical protein
VGAQVFERRRRRMRRRRRILRLRRRPAFEFDFEFEFELAEASARAGKLAANLITVLLLSRLLCSEFSVPSCHEMAVKER